VAARPRPGDREVEHLGGEHERAGDAHERDLALVQFVADLAGAVGDGDARSAPHHAAHSGREEGVGHVHRAAPFNVQRAHVCSSAALSGTATYRAVRARGERQRRAASGTDSPRVLLAYYVLTGRATIAETVLEPGEVRQAVSPACHESVHGGRRRATLVSGG